MQEAQERWVPSLGWEDPLEKEMTTHSTILAASSHGWPVSPVPMTFELPWCTFWTQLCRTSQFQGPPLAYLSLCCLPFSPLEAECQCDQGSQVSCGQLMGQDLFIGLCRVHMTLHHRLWKPWKWDHLVFPTFQHLVKKKNGFKTIHKNCTWMSCFH